jgi:plasmid stabilization system protein ParE
MPARHSTRYGRNMEFRVKLSRAVAQDTEEALQWLREKAPERATPWISGLMDAALSLEHNPKRCPQAAESHELGISIRQLLHGKKRGVYRILYLVRPDDQIVLIVRIRHASRDRLTREELNEALD